MFLVAVIHALSKCNSGESVYKFKEREKRNTFNLIKDPTLNSLLTEPSFFLHRLLIVSVLLRHSLDPTPRQHQAEN